MSDLYLYLMCSRNKDNKEVKGFKKRSKTILEYSFNEDKIEKMFEKFTAEGVPGEKTRLYRSVNSRNIIKIKEDLIIYLLKDHSYSSLTNINKVIASISEKKENRDESKWMFDFDEKNEDLANNFINDIEHIVTSGKINSIPPKILVALIVTSFVILVSLKSNLIEPKIAFISAPLNFSLSAFTS